MTSNEVESLAKVLQMPVFRVCSKDGRMINELFEFLSVMYFSKNFGRGDSPSAAQNT